MIIVSGWIRLKQGQRERFLAESAEAMVLARQAAGNGAFVVAADPLEDDLVNVYEQWDSEEALMAFRNDGPTSELVAMIIAADVKRHRIASSGPA